MPFFVILTKLDLEMFFVGDCVIGLDEFTWTDLQRRCKVLLLFRCYSGATKPSFRVLARVFKDEIEAEHSGRAEPRCGSVSKYLPFRDASPRTTS